jgi:hypothetical protein
MPFGQVVHERGAQRENVAPGFIPRDVLYVSDIAEKVVLGSVGNLLNLKFGCGWDSWWRKQQTCDNA